MSDIKVSVIIPYVQEAPQVFFTLRAVHEELKGIEHEVIAVDNFCAQVLEQMRRVHEKTGKTLYIDEGHARPDDKTLELPPAEWLERLLAGDLKAEEYSESRVAGAARHLDWLKHVRYSNKLSHWNAKNAGVAASSGELLLFLDAHVGPGRGSLSGMVEVYQDWVAEHGPGSLHAPLTYHILEEKKLVYSLVYAPERGELHYTWGGYRAEWDEQERRPHEVPCMSCCGVLISREVYDALGGWPSALGIYGGGEHFLNFTMAVMGMKHWVMAGPALHHYATHRGRGYHWVWDDYQKNRAVAAYMYGDRRWLEKFCRGHNKYARVPEFFEALVEAVPEMCAEQRAHVARQQKMEVEKWCIQRGISDDVHRQ